MSDLQTHIDEQVWVRVAQGDLPPREREQVMDHVVRCAECAAVWRAVDELQRRAPEADPALRSAPTRRLLLWLPALAAAAAVALVVSNPRPPSPSPSSDTLRAGSRPARPEVVFPAGGSLDGVPAELRFTPMAEARSHRVQVLSADGALLWDGSPVPGSPAAWPPSLRLPSGRYCWQVVAMPSWGRSGADEVSSTPACFSLRGP
jgi:hypothetical protein